MNFDFLKNTHELGYVYENCSNAEKLARTMPVQSIFTSRKSAELLAKLIYMAAYNQQMEDLSFADILADRTVRQFIRNREVLDAFHFIRKSGNRAVHGDEHWDAEDALDVLADLHYITGEIACKLGLIQDYPKFNDDIDIYPNAQYIEEDRIAEKAQEMFAAYITEYNAAAEREKYETPSNDELFDYAICGRVEMHERISFEHVPRQTALIAYIQEYLMNLYRLSVERAKENMSIHGEAVTLYAELSLPGNIVFNTNDVEPFLQAISQQLPISDGFTLDITCCGNLREFFTFTYSDGEEECNLLEKDSLWTGAGMLDKLEYFKRRDRFEYKIATFYPDSGEFLHHKILNGKSFDIGEHCSEEIVTKQFGDKWWSWNLYLWADFDFEEHQDTLKKLRSIMRCSIPKNEIKYCENAWNDGEDQILCNCIQWNTLSLKEIQSFLDQLNEILLPIKDELDAGGSGYWMVRKEFAVATWDWFEDGFKIIGCQY